jgi:serine/threonine protein kinase
VLVADSGQVKVADFGTSRFLEIAAHGTTVIASPPYMAPEQFQGKAMFASDIYSLGVTMYQMLTGVLPYSTPSPADLDKLMKGELVAPPRTRNPKIPQKINDIVMKAVAPDVTARYQRASDLLNDLLAARSRRKTTTRVMTRQTPATPRVAASSMNDVQDIHNRLRQKGASLSLQVDVTATPKHNNGAIFVQTIADYPLVEAISQNVVKHPVLPDAASRAVLTPPPRGVRGWGGSQMRPHHRHPKGSVHPALCRAAHSVQCSVARSRSLQSAITSGEPAASELRVSSAHLVTIAR